MAEKHLTRRELQSPDKFQAGTYRLIEWAREHPYDVAFAAVGLVVALVVVGLLLRGGTSHRRVPGGDELASALALVDREIAAPPAEGAAAVSTPEAETFPTQQAKQEAIAAAMTRIREEHAGSPAAVEAGMALADAMLHLGQTDEALKLYDEYLKEAAPDASLRFLAYEGKAGTLAVKNDLDGAKAAYEQMEKDLPAYRDRAIFGKATVLERQGKWDDARTLYEQLRDFEGGSVLAGAAGDRLASLNRLHPPPPAPPPGAGAPPPAPPGPPAGG